MRLDRTARLLTNRPLIIAMLEIFTKGNDSGRTDEASGTPRISGDDEALME